MSTNKDINNNYYLTKENMRFTKMHGTGNDYVYVNGFEETIGNLSEVAIQISDRHKGIGSDGLVVILPSETCDFRMRMFNADGSESEMCGNASRCIGKYVYDKGLTNKTTITLETLAGIKLLNLIVGADNKVETVTVDMGEPILEGLNIPTVFDEPLVIDKSVDFGNGINYNITCVSMGNPHTVIFTTKIEKIDLQKVGPFIENASIFPRRTNTEFIEVVSRDYVKMRVWERGSGETLACGTGACAAVVAGVLNDLNERKTTVELLGGELNIEWCEADNHVYLTGGAEIVYEGEIILIDNA